MQPTGAVLNGALATYGDVPRLGPPLPGDLGRPILERQQQLAMAPDPEAQQLQQAEATERERRSAELKAARESGLLVQDRQVRAATEMATVPAVPPSQTALAAPQSASGPDTQGHNAAFVAALDPNGDLNPHVLIPLPSPYTLMAGSVISASLITGLRSDLPGLVTAQVIENTYYSATGQLPWLT